MKKIIKNTWHPFRRLSPILSLLFLFLWLRSCQEEVGQASRYENNLKAKESALRRYRLSNGQLAYEKDLLEVTNAELKDQLWAKDDSLQLLLKKLREPVVAIKWNTRYVYDSLYLPFDSPVEQDFQRNFNLTEEWFSLSGYVNQAGVSVEKLTIPNIQRLVVGYKKGSPVVSVSNSNPFIVTESLEGQLVHLRSKDWVFGIGGTWNVFQPPSAGFFLGYKIFEF